MARLSATATAKVSAGFRLLVLLASFAFAVQGYLVQTHIHDAPVTAAARLLHIAPPDRPSPSDPYNPATCPLCQEILKGAGVYTATAPVFLVLPLAAPVAAVLPVTRALRTAAPLFGWQSRGPPRS